MRLLVLYGSQTGTAQDVAEKIWRESKNYSFAGPFMSMDDYNVSNLIHEQLVVFVAATTGQGEEPDNMKKFWKFLLRKNLPTESLKNLRFACLGLGDSSYPQYNFAAKKLNKRLRQLSATPIIPMGLCDDQHDHGMAATMLPWIENLWITLQKIYPFINEKPLKEFCFKWNVCDCNNLNHLKWPLKEEPSSFQIIENIRTTSDDHFQDVRLMKLKFPDNLTWNPGDVIQVRPWNSDEKVDELFKIFAEHKLSFNQYTVVKLKQNFEDLPLPLPYRKPVSLGLMAKYVWDLSAVPRQGAFGLLAINCEDELEKEKLEEFTTAEGLEDLIAYANRPRRTILEILYDFRHATAALTLPILFELFQIIQPRSFSIASVPKEGSLNLLVAVVEYKTKLSTPRLGLCSNWLKSLKVGDEILGTIKRGTFVLPNDLSTPMIMVGPGTGIAPFISVLMEREFSKVNAAESLAMERESLKEGNVAESLAMERDSLEGSAAESLAMEQESLDRNIAQSLTMERQSLERNVAESLVVFGCRNKEKDFYCREYFDRFEAKGIAKCLTAFSRDQCSKIYVQHLIRDNAQSVKDLVMNKNAVVLVAGSSNNMPKSVKEAFVEVLQNEAYVEEMIKTKRYQEETWS